MRLFKHPLSIAAVVTFVIVGTFTASMALAAKKPAPTTVEAIVIRLDGANLLVYVGEERHLKRLSFSIGGQTAVTVDAKPARLTDLHNGQRVVISPPTGTALKIEEAPPKKSRAPEAGLAEGVVVKTVGTTLVIRTPLSNGNIADMEIATDAGTVVSVEGKPVKLGDLMPGQTVLVAMSGGNARRIVVQSSDHA